ncbi:MAG TPA: hypothetical protein PKA03_10180 [Tabrizicola sp.]|nr:hypothetical protein [Tabrizicola sp.]
MDADLDARGFGATPRDLSAGSAWQVVEKARSFRSDVMREAELLTSLFVAEAKGQPD